MKNGEPLRLPVKSNKRRTYGRRNFRSKDELQGELDVPMPAAKGGHETRVDLSLIASDEEIRIVEEVVELGSELHSHSLGDLEVFIEARVEIPVAGATEGVPGSHGGRVRAEIG